MEDRSELVASRAFLGTEFLTWLWRQSEKDDGLFDVDGQKVRAWIDDRMSLQTLAGDAQEDSFKGGTPSRSPEAQMALKQGKKVSKARLLVRKGERDWSCSIVGRTLDLSSIKLPGVLSKADDDRFYERMSLLEELFDLLHSLYALFLDTRLGPGWADEILEIRAWTARPID